MRFLLLIFVLGVSVHDISAQRPAKPKIPDAVPAKPAIDKGFVNGESYVNTDLGLEIRFAEPWQIASDEFTAELKTKGFDLDLKVPGELNAAAKARVSRAIRSVDILVTAYRPGAVARISIENLAAYPQIKDAVDYLDAIRSTYAVMKLPADFTYSETQAEKLGTRQFGFIDIVSGAGRKRMYATVRRGHAILFTVSHKTRDDLESFRAILAAASF